MEQTIRSTRGHSAAVLMQTAQRLFAERGVDGVTVREIAEAAGQKNHAAVGYHFGSKEALIRELIIDGARRIDQRRNAWLDRLEAAGGPTTVRQVVKALVYPSVNLDDRGDDSYNRFIVMLGQTHRELLIDTLGQRWNSGFLRCMEALRRLMPPMDEALQTQRLVFIEAYLGAVLSRRERRLADHSRRHPTWESPATLEHFIDTMTALINTPAPAPQASD